MKNWKGPLCYHAWLKHSEKTPPSLAHFAYTQAWFLLIWPQYKRDKMWLGLTFFYIVPMHHKAQHLNPINIGICNNWWELKSIIFAIKLKHFFWSSLQSCFVFLLRRMEGDKAKTCLVAILEMSLRRDVFVRKTPSLSSHYHNFWNQLWSWEVVASLMFPKLQNPKYPP